MIPFATAIKNGFKKTFVYSGRATCAEFNYFLLLSFVLGFVLIGTSALLADATGEEDICMSVGCLMAGSLVLPMMSLTVRRLHDAGHSGWIMFLLFIPIVQYFVISYTQQPSDRNNEWGERPYYPSRKQRNKESNVNECKTNKVTESLAEETINNEKENIVVASINIENKCDSEKHLSSVSCECENEVKESNAEKKTPRKRFVGIFIACVLVVLSVFVAIILSIPYSPANEDVEVPSSWAEYKFNNGSFSIKVPPTVELRGEHDAYTRMQSDFGLNAHMGKNYAVFQQKGLAFNLDEARSKYARIMLAFESNMVGTFPGRSESLDHLMTYREVCDVIDGELNGLGENARAYNIAYGGNVVNGNQCYVISYDRTGAFGALPVKCKICIFFNDRYFVKILYSYREKESGIWAKDFEKSLQTFRWLK